MSVGENKPDDATVSGDAAKDSVSESDSAATERVDSDGAASESAEPNREDPALAPMVVALREELAAAKASLDQNNARLRAVSKAYTDLQAENKSFKERMEHRAKLDSELQAFDQVRTFFDPVMNLKRSIHTPGQDLTALTQGLSMVLGQFMEALSKLGLTEVPGVGATFDPQVHEALGLQPVTDPEQDGKVLVVHTTGFKVGGRVLQAAQVVIGKFEEAAGEA
ncbi:MAG: nucleotide exchange factor GrpE [Myxococcota bacterium]